MKLTYTAKGTIPFKHLRPGDCFCFPYNLNELCMLTDNVEENENSCFYNHPAYVELDDGTSYYQVDMNEEVVPMDAKVVVMGRKDL